MTAITEDASKRRADAASSLIKNEVDYGQISNMFENFQVTSTNTNDLTNNEFKILASFRSGLDDQQTKIIATLQLIASAVVASGVQASSTTFTNVLAYVDSIDIIFQTIDNSISDYGNKSNFNDKLSVVNQISGNIDTCINAVGNILLQLHSLMFA